MIIIIMLNVKTLNNYSIMPLSSEMGPYCNETPKVRTLSAITHYLASYYNYFLLPKEQAIC